MEPFAEDIRAAVETRSERLLELARRVTTETPGFSGRYTDEELGQLVNGFTAVLLEALEGETRAKRDLLMETAIPALVADGQSVASLVRAATTFGVLVVTELSAAVAPEHRDAAIAFLADFFGGYVTEIVETALASAG